MEPVLPWTAWRRTSEHDGRCDALPQKHQAPPSRTAWLRLFEVAGASRMSWHVLLQGVGRGRTVSERQPRRSRTAPPSAGRPAPPVVPPVSYTHLTLPTSDLV